MQSWKRHYGYIEDYYRTLYQIYGETYISYPITYYSLDLEKSVYDRDILEAGSYEKNGAGDLSGIRWKKIIFFPVYAIEGIQPSSTADEKGVHITDSMNTSMVYPSTYGITPSEWDMVVFHQSFMFNNENQYKNTPIFIVVNTEPGTYGTLTHYKCSLKQNPVTRHVIENQISSRHIFIESTRKIYEINRGYFLLNLEKKMKDINGSITDDIFDNKTGFYLQKTN